MTCFDERCFVSCAGTFSMDAPGIPGGTLLSVISLMVHSPLVPFSRMPTSGLLELLDWFSDFLFSTSVLFSR